MSSEANDITVTIADNDITVNVVENVIQVSAVTSGPPGPPIGATLTDYAIKGQLVNWTGAVTINMDVGNSVQATLTGNVTSVAFAGWPDAGDEGKITLYLVQGAGGPRTVSGWPAAVKWVAGGTPVLANTVGQADVFVFSSLDAGTNIYGFHLGTTT